MKVKLIRTFIPSIDFEVSKQFYIDLGFSVLWENHELVELGTKEYNFFLQKYYNKEWADNLMMQLFVEDLDALFEVANNLIDKYNNTKIKPIFVTDYGRTFHLIGPAGVLWHMTETKTDVQDESKLICEDN